MSEATPVIELQQVSKRFDVYKSPRARMLATLGLPVRKAQREEFVAAQDITFSVKPGERVGLVGRNGAGKSTVLKMVAGLLQPTSGHIVVRGKVQALLELGTGFHPEFSGRQNVFASLAYQGVSGEDARRAFEDVLDFSELDDFIDRPVKTYSAGMYARLAFATATAVRPEVLIVDEILGAGDAYFAMKSSQRMRELTGTGTTLLFVSHDIAAVQMMCDRAIWIDRGRMIADDLPHEVSKRYSASIRKQAELRLKADNLKLMRSHVESIEGDVSSTVVCRLVSPEGTPIPSPVRIFSIAAEAEGVELDTLAVGGARDNDAAEVLHLLTAPEFMNWGPAKKDNTGRSYREVGEFGGVYRHAPFLLKTQAVAKLQNVGIAIEHGAVGADVHLEVQQFGESGYRSIGRLPVGPAATTVLKLVDDDEVTSAIEKEAVVDLDARYGTDIAAIRAVGFSGEDGRHRFVYEVGEALNVHVSWELAESTIVQEARWVVCVYGLDGRCVSQVLSPMQRNIPREGNLTATFAPSRLGRGDYLISVGLFDGLADGNPGGEDPVCVLDRSFKIRVTSPPQWVERGLVLQDAAWSIEAVGA